MAMKLRMKGGPRNTITSLTVMVKATERGMRPTPTVDDSSNVTRDCQSLTRAVMFPTPTASGTDNAGGSNSRKTARENGTYVNGQLNPTWVEWLMGFPPGWTDLEPSATP